MAYKSDDMLGDADAMTKEAGAATAPEGEEPSADENTFLISKSALSGKSYEPGSVIKARVLRDLGDQVEVACEHDDEESPEEDKAEGSEEPPGVGAPQDSSYLE